MNIKSYESWFTLVKNLFQ